MEKWVSQIDLSCQVEASFMEEEIKVESQSLVLIPEPIATPIEEEAVPLSGNPFFKCILPMSSITRNQLLIPTRFKHHLPSTKAPVIFSCRNKKWELIFHGDQANKKFDIAGWRRFARDNNLKIGDGCVFELMDSKDLLFKVQIISGEIPAELRSRVDGYSSNAPIFID